MIQSRTTREFREAFVLLPEDVRIRARRAYRLFRHNPRHSSLRFKKVDDDSNIYSGTQWVELSSAGRVGRYDGRVVLDWIPRRV